VAHAGWRSIAMVLTVAALVTGCGATGGSPAANGASAGTATGSGAAAINGAGFWTRGRLYLDDDIRKLYEQAQAAG
jgi:hypothetical protein